MGQRYTGEIRTTLFDHISQLPTNRLSGKRTGSLAIRFVGDLTAIKSWAGSGISRCISLLFVIPGSLIVLGMFDRTIALFSAGIVFLTMLVPICLGRQVQKAHIRVRQLRGRMAADMNERLPLSGQLRQQGRILAELAQLKKRIERLRIAAIHRRWVSGGVALIPELGIALMTTVFVILAGRLSLDGPTLAASLAILGILGVPLFACWQHC